MTALKAILSLFTIVFISFTIFFVFIQKTRLNSPPAPQVREGIGQGGVETLVDVPHVEPIEERFDADQLVAKVLPILQDRAQKVGYKLVYQGDTEDGTGRTVLANAQRFDRNGNVARGFGGETLGLNRIFDLHHEVGVFERWEPISGSEDLYLILKDPLRNQNFTVRVGREPSELYDGSAYLTGFAVEDLDVGPKNFYEKDFYFDLGYIKDWAMEDLEKIIKPGDVIVGFNSQHDVDKETELREYVKKDSQGVPAVMGMSIRRLGGVDALIRGLGLRSRDELGSAGRTVFSEFNSIR